jgi:hypothetical protein
VLGVRLQLARTLKQTAILLWLLILFGIGGLVLFTIPEHA